MAKKKAKPKTKKSAPPLEESLQQLQQTVAKLEGGNLSLSDSLEQYEKGIASLKLAYQALNDAQQRIEMLVDLDQEGNLVTHPFDNTASEQVTEGSRRSSRRNPVASDDGSQPDDVETGAQDIDDPNSLF